MGILRITVEDTADVAASGARLHLVVAGTAAVLGNAAGKRAAEVRDLVAALTAAGVDEAGIEVTGVRLASTEHLLGRNQKAQISLRVAVEPGQLPAALGVLADRPNLSLEHLEWVYDTFEASIPLAAAAMVRARRKADAVAAAAGLRVTGIANASDSWSMPGPHESVAYGMLAARGRAADLDLGVAFSSTTQVSVNLSVAVELGE